MEVVEVDSTGTVCNGDIQSIFKRPTSTSRTYRLKRSTAKRSVMTDEVSTAIMMASSKFLLSKLSSILPYALDKTLLNDEKLAIWLRCNATKHSDNSAGRGMGQRILQFRRSTTGGSSCCAGIA